MDQYILKKRLGYFIAAGNGTYMKANWPIGSLVLYRDRLIINTATKQFTIEFCQINSLKSGLLSLHINHQHPKVPKDIDIYGFFLSKSLKRAIKENQLSIKFQ